jgi:hypothetical protein
MPDHDGASGLFRLLNCGSVLSTAATPVSDQLAKDDRGLVLHAAPEKPCPAQSSRPPFFGEAQISG